jgi:coenzyme PQQ precursor peptide PqqA
VEVGRAEGLRGTRTYDSLILTGDTVGDVTLEETENMTWQTPKIEEISCSCEINSYSNGDFV